MPAPKTITIAPGQATRLRALNQQIDGLLRERDAFAIGVLAAHLSDEEMGRLQQYAPAGPTEMTIILADVPAPDAPTAPATNDPEPAP